MTMYCFYQREMEGKWELALASDRDRIVRDVKPALMTALDVSSNFEEEMTAADKAGLKYHGDLYFDFDGESIEDVIPQFQKFLTDLLAKGVNLNTMRLFATGGRGFHAFIPSTTLMSKMPPTGMLGLPHIYLEVANNLYVETLDLRIYSSGRGRQLRQANVLRKNGAYKVQVSPDEVMSMTAERYASITAGPRPLFPVEPAVFNPALGLLFSKAKDKVEAAVKKRKNKKPTADVLQRFAGEWPDTIKGLLMGVGLAEGVGFNRIALQLGIAAVGLGKTEEQYLQDAQGLIETHAGDGERYGTPRKRRDELRDKFRYATDSVCYEFSVGGILSLCCPELRNGSELKNGDFVPDAPEVKQVVAEDGTVTEVVTEPEDHGEGGVRINKSGIWALKEGEWGNVSDMGLDKPLMLMMPNREIIGYEVDVYVSGQLEGREMITHNMLGSKAAMQQFTLTKSCSMRATDVQTSMIADILRKRTKKMNEVALITQSVGVDVVCPPGAKTPEDYEIIWSSPEQVLSLGGNRYRYRGTIDNKNSFFSDLLLAKDLSLDDEGLVDDMLHINSAANVARMVGWFVAAFLSPVLRKFYGDQFPSLQVYGAASAGKTQSVALLNHLHHHLSTPKEFSAAGQTHFPIIAAMGTSSSVPVVIEELKPRELDKKTYDFLLNIFRGNYNALAIARGGVSKDSGANGTIVSNYANRAPLVFVGEAMETQTAMLARCVMVALSAQDRAGCTPAFERCQSRSTELGRIGKSLMQGVLALDVPTFRARFDTIHSQVKEAVRAQGKVDSMERPIYNLAVLTMGLEFLKQTLNRTFGERFDERMVELIETISLHVVESLPENMSEASKVMDVLAQLTRIDDQYFRLVRDVEYTVDADGNPDIKMKPAYARYIKYTRSLGLQPLYDNDAAFIGAMFKYPGVTAKACPDNPVLFNNAFEPIFRFSAKYLEKEGIEPFS